MATWNRNPDGSFSSQDGLKHVPVGNGDHREIQARIDAEIDSAVDVAAPNSAPADAAALIAAGIDITSASNPTLDGTYPLDELAQKRIAGLVGQLPRLPKGLPTVTWATTNSTPVQWSAAEITLLSNAMTDYLYDIEQTLNLKLAEQEAEWPTLPVALD